MIDKVCHLETALLYSQGRSNIIAASDSVKIHFNLRHRGAQDVQSHGRDASFTSLSKDAHQSSLSSVT